MKKVIPIIIFILYVALVVIAQHGEVDHELKECIDKSGVVIASSEGVCFRHVPYITWSFGITDFVITICYILIPAGLYNPVRELPENLATVLRRFGILLALFIASCGATHALKVILIEYSIWNIAIGFNVLCAILSTICTIHLWLYARPVLIQLARNIAILANMASVKSGKVSELPKDVRDKMLNEVITIFRLLTKAGQNDKVQPIK